MAVAFARPVEFSPTLSAPPRAGVGRLRKIGLLGSHERSLDYAPWDDPSWEFWAHASSRGMFKRAPDRYFDLHRQECWSKSNNKGQKYLRWLETNHVPVFMQARYPHIPASVEYPFQRLAMETPRPYFTNHVAYMIALALAEGVTHIGFFGVNYGVDSEYGTQRGSAEFWMGVAHGKGVQLVIPDTCTLLADPKKLYGYESHDEHGLLVPEYRKRVHTPQAVDPDRPLMADGRVTPPSELLAAMRQERLENPAPVGAFASVLDRPVLEPIEALEAAHV
jgi:hypothetical protein